MGGHEPNDCNNMKMMRDLSKVVLVSLGVAIVGSATNVLSAVAFVGVGNGNTDTFTPSVTNINVGDQVVWQWNSPSVTTKHSSTSGIVGVPNGLWGSLTNLMPYTFTNTFNSAGSFRYYCGIHFSSLFNMTGAVVVATANLPPSVAITNPLSGAVFAAPANVTIQASASGNGGTVTNVQFLVDANILTNKAAAPYFAITNNLAAGSHTLAAVASDNGNLKNTNTITITVVTPVTVLLSAPQRLSSANFRFSYAANPGLVYVVQRSTNLVSANWTALLTNTAVSSPVNFTDQNATISPDFYRVGLMPNP